MVSPDSTFSAATTWSGRMYRHHHNDRPEYGSNNSEVLGRIRIEVERWHVFRLRKVY